MASTFSPTLRLELIGEGDQSGIWGQTTNQNLGSLLEQAITGVQNITMLDANYTMTNFNGVVDEARNAVLVVGGTLTQQRNLIAPLVEKVYTVKNSTSGGFGVQIVGASGTGVVIPNGQTLTVYCDGTDFYTTLTGTTGNFRVAGNLNVVGTTTLSSALTYGGVTLSNAVTGTGSMVLSASPTFTGTPLAPTATTGTNTTQIATTAFVQASTTALGLGTMSTQNANAVAITGGTMTGMTSIAGGTVAGTTGTFSGNVASLGIVSGASAVFGAISGTTGTFSSTISGTTITASSQFSGAGTGLTGTAASLSIGGNSATTSQTNFSNLTIGGSQVLSAANYNSYAPTLTGGNASGTWAINISGVTTNTGSNGYGTRTVSTSAPSGGSNGDIWYKV